jgi:hypothetical protein
VTSTEAVTAQPAGSGLVTPVAPPGLDVRFRGAANPVTAPRQANPLTHASVAVPAAGETTGDRNSTRGPQRAGPTRSVAQRCEDHIEALYMRAYLQLGDRTAAQDAVIAAVASAAGLPSTPPGVTVSVWHVLAARVHSIFLPDDQAVTDPDGSDAAGAQPVELVRQHPVIRGSGVGPDLPAWRPAASSPTNHDLQGT